VPRYQIGETVRIRDVITSRYAGQSGRVIGVRHSPRGENTLDKYTVLFPAAEQEEFWDIQLEQFSERPE
jgi:hypothetical protein